MHFFYSKNHPAASDSKPIDEFEFINDFGFEEYKDIRQKPLSLHLNEGIEICYVTKGRYEWVVGDKSYLLFPGDGFVTCPWQEHGSPREVVDLGEIYWVVIKPAYFSSDGNFNAGNWSRLSDTENEFIGGILSRNENHKLIKAHILKSLFVELKNELEHREFGYRQRVSNLAEEFLIAVVRHIKNRESRNLKNQNWFSEFDLMLKADLSKKWTLDEMASLENIGITTLIRLVKESTGYTPANYLIFLRLEKAKELLKTSSKKLTDIAYDCGFYSSQHFSSTFSKWIGKSPLTYRKMLKTS
ncbi:AraC family transcriptional regulator [Prolixibacteraceae bacterium Z1-6]|uniref:AraC family transcriptional regulator n=1 Tax=Draconibacterium aestuarii TaxID=2998507 RepID=A0A9X3F9K7_9BACT|nr:AraC family transcriptional regulator [Prolixibacteraceae bacterium Z1-6]